MSSPMRIKIARDGARVTLKILMAHDMETGLRRDADGQLIPAWFIRQVDVWLGQDRVLSADWGPAISKNPFVQVELRDALPGERVRVEWRDNHVDAREDSATVP